MKAVKDSIIFITGAGNGIGKNLAITLHQLGAKLILTDIDVLVLTELSKTWNSSNYVSLKLNVASVEDWKRCIDIALNKFNRIDYLINVAGVIEPGYIYETSLDAIDKQIDINLKGTIYGTHLVSAQMVKQKSGHIINFGSLASLAPVPGINIYSATKFGIRGFSLAIAEELIDHRVFISVICPDAVKTPMLDYQKDKPEAALTFSGTKFLTVEEVTKVVLEDAIQKKERDIWIPKYRGLIAMSGNVFPGIAHDLKNYFMKSGKKNQQKYNQNLNG